LVGIMDERISMGFALGRQGLSQQDSGHLLEVGIDRYHRRRDGVDIPGSPVWGSGQERHLEPGLLIESTASGKKHCGEYQKGEKRLLSIVHLSPRTMKIKRLARVSARFGL